MTLALRKIQEHCHNKSIIIIGNGKNQIDQFPEGAVIVRMNHGVVGGHTNIWINNLAQGESITNRLYNQCKVDYILRLNAEYNGKRLRTGVPKTLLDKTYFWEISAFNDMTKTIDSTRPLTGTTTVFWFLAHVNCKELTITGIDFFKTKNIYTNTSLAKVHTNIKNEENYLLNLVQEGKIKWI